MDCIRPEALTDIPLSDCEINFDQIIMLIYQRTQAAAPFTDATIKLLATWTPLLAAADSKKIVMTPKFAGLTIPQSAALTQGGNDNTTINGIPIYNGEGFVDVTAQISGMSSDTKAAIKTLTPESQANSLGLSNLTVYLVNRFGDIISNNYRGFPIYNNRISSVGSEGLNSRNQNQLGFSFGPDWDNNLAITKRADLGFDPLTQLITPA